MKATYPDTPDGKYFVIRGRLWRKANPSLDPDFRDRLVNDLMAARRAVQDANGDEAATAAARQQVDETKVALGERGSVWWKDGAPDFNRHLAKNTPYATSYAHIKNLT